MKESEITINDRERFPAIVSVALLITHGRSGRLLLTRHGLLHGNRESWGPVAGGVEEGESAWVAALREAKEEANLSPENLIFVRGKDSFDPHVALINIEDKISLGLVYDVTYSGPKVSFEGWNITNDQSVDRVRYFTWQETLDLLEKPDKIYRPEFNIHQLIRWNIKHMRKSTKRNETVGNWLQLNNETFPGLLNTSNNWTYTPPYNSWVNLPNIHGDPARTNFARKRFYLE